MKLKSLLAASVLVCSVPIWAADGRIRTEMYNPDKVVAIDGRVGVQLTIEFGENERIENVAIGDSTTWQVTPNKRANLLFLKPLHAGAKTNMTVVTDRRTYLFDLDTRQKASAVYAFRFLYPEPEPALTLVADSPDAALIPSEPAATSAILADPKSLNFNWRPKGDSKLLPARVFDDGKAVFLSWGKDQTLPGIFAPAPDGGEGAVNYTMEGEYIVVDSVPSRLTLRFGKQVATLDRAAAPSSASGKGH